ncbi:ribosomal-protein-serine acetyltransferase [Paenibacillus selenitireducens]|uniref:Ribosomal-protein-serine acetyltransferase n=1 Tax=Paenibacillus selenitireducens TaxID=1324314 RepID=A0A1T2X4V5_9BACL|nr:GNAT family protein [Paenibacillus selenitireducens]OPA74603.1 ribosomal-protein-serine acetyltransferase [Paenibacillus selenitireducens]
MFTYQVDGTISLKLFETRDAEALFQLIDSNREHLSSWLSFPTMTWEVEDSKKFIESKRMSFAKEEGYWLGIWIEETLVGSIGYLYLDQDHRKTEIGYWLGKEFEGNGYVSRSVKALIQHAFVHYNLNKVEIGVASDNEKSRAIPEKLGFIQEGVLRDYELLQGRFLDRVMYGLTQEEWRNK